jgi:hypothetical protein
MDNLIFRFRALCNRLQTPRTQATQATTAEPTSTTVGTFSSYRAMRDRFQQARTQPTLGGFSRGATAPVEPNGTSFNKLIIGRGVTPVSAAGLGRTFPTGDRCGKT